MCANRATGFPVGWVGASDAHRLHRGAAPLSGTEVDAAWMDGVQTTLSHSLSSGMTYCPAGGSQCNGYKWPGLTRLRNAIRRQQKEEKSDVSISWAWEFRGVSAWNVPSLVLGENALAVTSDYMCSYYYIQMIILDGKRNHSMGSPMDGTPPQSED